MKQIKILWIDDEIDLLNMHLKFLETKGYYVKTATNTVDAEEILKTSDFDIIFLDENMPGVSGLDFLPKIKEYKPFTPVIMITKVEDENIMEEAIGSKINDYLIKPVNPKQILLVIKKHVQQKKIITQKTTENYQRSFSKVATDIFIAQDCNSWINIYKQLVNWELELENIDDNNLKQILDRQKEDANTQFAKFVKNNYLDWINSKYNRPFFLTDVIKKRILPKIADGKKVLLIVIDNLRYDQWKMLQRLIKDDYKTQTEEIIFSILPTATQYARNAFFAGIMPFYIKKQYPQFWRDEEVKGNKNDFEPQLLQTQLNHYAPSIKFSFNKIFNENQSKKLINNLQNILKYDLNVMVFNFVDMLSHAKTSVQMVKELAKDEAAYRSLTQIWFEHSYLNTLFKKLLEHNIEIFITTDHGSILIKNPIKIIADRETSTNLRYKQGKNISFSDKKVFVIKKPKQAGLPTSHITSIFIFASGRDFFVYPNNYNHFVNYYKNTFQHGGISLEEMLIPLVQITKK